MYLQCIRYIKHILVMFQVCIKRYRVHKKISYASNVSIKCIRCIKNYQVYQGVYLGISNVYKMYQTYISNEDICDLLMRGLRFVFVIFSNNKVCVLWT